MGVLEKKVQIRGDAKAIWQTVLNLLEMNRYVIGKQLPYSQVSASAGSKAISALLGGTKDGYRDLLVSIVPQGKDLFEVIFRFGLPSWTLNYPGIKKDCSRLVDDVVMRMEHGWGEVSAPQKNVSCDKCGALNPSSTAFCPNCGNKLEPPPRETIKAAESPACAKCGSANPVGALFCVNCGEKIPAPATQEEKPLKPPVCTKCGATLPENAKFCFQCGTPLGQ